MWIHCVHVSQSSGILSPSGAKISEDLQMNQVEYGCISPVYSIGRWVGAVLFSFVFNSINRKYIMVFAGITHGIINMFYMFTSNGYVILALRAFAGIGHIWPPIYTGLWIGQLSIQKYAKFWKNCSSICSPFGRASGFFIDLFAGAENWRWGFFYNGFVLFTCGMIFLFIPNIYFSSKLVAVTNQEGKEEIRPSKTEVESSIFNVRASDPHDRDVNVFERDKSLLTDPFYMILLWARCTNNFLRSALQFWLVKYIISLGYTNKPLTTFVFAYMITCNPLIGNLIGARLSGLFGSYYKKSSLYYVLIWQIVACAAFTPAPYFEEWWKFCIFASLYQVLGMANVSPIGNIMSTSLNKEQKKRNAGVTAIFNVIIGSVPAPPIYGLILDRWGEYNKHVAMIAYKNYLYFTVPAIICAIIIREYRFRNKGEPLIGEKKEDVVEYKEPMQEYVDDFKLKKTDLDNKGTEMKEV
jgi:sugar phosphate permease